MMPLPTRSWTVCCRACDLVIGAVEGGRFVHDPTCSKPLTIGVGSLRCCQCGGPLTGEQQPLAAGDGADADVEAADEERAVPVLRFLRAALSDSDTRQRL